MCARFFKNSAFEIKPSELKEIIKNFAGNSASSAKNSSAALDFLLYAERFQSAGIPETLLSSATFGLLPSFIKSVIKFSIK